MDLFVYGTLRNAQLLAAVAGGAPIQTAPARINGFIIRPVAGDVVPCVIAQDGRAVAGLVLRDLDPDQIARLDLFEAAFGYTLAPVSVITAQGPRDVQMYFPPDGVAFDDRDWYLSDWESSHLAPTLYAVDEVFSYDPMLDALTLRRMWPMIEKRAWAKHRARIAAPSNLRHTPSAGDFQIATAAPPAGQFFRFDRVSASHRRFDGAVNADMPREVFVGTDAVMILPYDPMRDRVLLVEQFRMGPARRGDPNPWTLEAIAGMVDARETPLEAGLREAMEEANLTITGTKFMAGYYPSPGANTDYFTCYLGFCDLPDTRSYTGGLAAEHEDLRLHIMGFAEAMALVETGEINIGPLITMLYWLDRERHRLKP